MNANSVPADLKRRMKDSYDSIAAEFNAWAIPDAEQRLSYVGNLLARLPSNARILELGAGCGLPVGKYILDHSLGAHLTANDLSSAQIAFARQNLHKETEAGRVAFLEGDMTTLEISEGSLDAVVAMYSIFHLPRSEQVELLNKIASKWLKPGGYLLANFSGKDTGDSGVVVETWMGPKGWVFYSGYGEEGTKKAAKDAGFEILLSEVVDRTLWVIARTISRSA